MTKELKKIELPFGSGSTSQLDFVFMRCHHSPKHIQAKQAYKLQILTKLPAAAACRCEIVRPTESNCPT